MSDIEKKALLNQKADLQAQINVSSFDGSIEIKKIETILHSEGECIDKAIELTLYCMKTQIFIDGNKRASVIFANHFMIQSGEGLLVIPENIVEEFGKLLVEYNEGRNEKSIKAFLKEKCWR